MLYNCIIKSHTLCYTPCLKACCIYEILCINILNIIYCSSISILTLSKSVRCCCGVGWIWTSISNSCWQSCSTGILDTVNSRIYVNIYSVACCIRKSGYRSNKWWIIITAPFKNIIRKEYCWHNLCSSYWEGLADNLGICTRCQFIKFHIPAVLIINSNFQRTILNNLWQIYTLNIPNCRFIITCLSSKCNIFNCFQIRNWR